MLLHNFILDHDREDVHFFRDFNISMDRTQQVIYRKTGEVPRPLVSDNNEPRTACQLMKDDRELQTLGEMIRHRLTVKLASRDLGRPLQHHMEYNSYGHIFMTN
jgi:hypothetical protein